MNPASSAWKRVGRYSLAPAMVALALALSLRLHGTVPHAAQYLLLAAVLASGWLGGWVPGLLAALAAVLAFDYFFLLPLPVHTAGQRAAGFALPFLLCTVAAAWMGATRAAARQAQVLLEQSEGKFRRILTNLPDIAWTANAARRILYISPKCDSILGYSNQEIYRSGSRLLLGRVHPEDRDRVQRAMDDLFQKSGVLNIEFRFQRRDGVWIWLHGRGSRYGVGGAVFADGVMNDISPRKEAEAQLIAKTAFLEAQTDATLDGLLVVNADGQEILRNRRFSEMFSIPPELLAAPDHAPILEHARRLMKDPDGFLARVLYLYAHPDEISREEIEFASGQTVDRYSAPVKGSDGRSFGRIWVFRDITESRRTEIELRSKTALFEALANSTIDGLLVVDAQGRRILHNTRLAQMFDVPSGLLAEPEQLPLRRHILDMLENSDRWAALIPGIYENHEETFRSEVPLRNGSIFDTYSSPVHGPGGEYYGRVWTFRDITDRKRQEDALRQLSAAVEQSPASVIITNPDGAICYVNRKFTAVTGYSAEEVLGKNPRLLNSGYSPPEMYRTLWRTLREGREWRGELRNRKKNGELFWEAASISPITRADGTTSHYVAVQEDITERRRLEAELRQSQKMEGIGQLAAGIAHEINTPIQFISDNLTFLEEACGGIFSLLESCSAVAQALSPEAAASLRLAEQKCDLEFLREEMPHAIAQSLEGTRRVAAIVRAMKEFSHPDPGATVAFNLNQGIASTITIARHEWKYVADVNTDFEESLPPLQCVSGEINQVVLNLIVNAAWAIRERPDRQEKGQITVRTRRRDGFAEIAVSDTGGGIPPEIQGRIFEPFFTTREVGSGTGQGLALAHSVIVRKHRGRIWFETEVGKGTTFFIQLPFASAQEQITS